MSNETKPESKPESKPEVKAPAAPKVTVDSVVKDLKDKLDQHQKLTLLVNESAASLGKLQSEFHASLANAPDSLKAQFEARHNNINGQGNGVDWKEEIRSALREAIAVREGV